MEIAPKRNSYVYELDIDFDVGILSNIVSNTSIRKDLRHFQYPSDIDSYTQKIKNQFPFLSPVFNVYKSISYNSSPIHIDAHRQAALNIPLYGTEHSYTIFYSRQNVMKQTYNSVQFFYMIESPVEECFRFTLTRPTIINTTYPHSVQNGPEIRAILSWSIEPEYSFDQILNLIPNMSFN